MNPGTHARWGMAASLLLAAGAAADDALTLRAPELSLNRAPEERTQAPPSRFGEARSRWWTVGLGYANDFHQTNDYNIQAAYSYFLVDDVEVVMEVNAWYFDQEEGDDAFGAGPTLGFRWHFYNQDPWTIFADIGVGLLFTSDSVPDGGTSFDFTPRAGFGFTRRLSDDGMRLQGGARWHHISNARIFGDSSNPGRDGVMVYAGIEWPF